MNLPNKFLNVESADEWIKEFSKDHPEAKVRRDSDLFVKVEWSPEENSARTRIRLIKIGDIYAGGR